VSKNIVIVGGGLAGLAASIYLARAGRTVTVFEKRQYLGGRAITNLRHGFRFNLGAHAFYRAGAGASVYRELGIPVRGALAKPKAIALLGGEEYRLPTGYLSLFATSLLSFRGKRELAMALFRIRRFGGSRAGAMTLREWLDANFSDERARSVLRALLRMVTFSDDPEHESAALPLAQMKVALRGALYVDEGWQKIVDSLHSAAVASGVNFITSSRIVGVHHDGAVRAVELGGLELDADRMDTQALAYPEMPPEAVQGARLPADTVILAVDPITAAELVGDAGKEWASAQPVHAACLDVSLRSLPDPKRTFALGIDEGVYFSVHSAFAQLAPKGGALVQLLRYGTGDPNPERTLESLLDRMQPGWRDVLVHRRSLPSMTVSSALVTPSRPRPSAVTNVKGLYIAGDWVESEGMLSDAALASARAAAKAILSTP
jgi:phytoene dehydrogenase-like protein